MGQDMSRPRPAAAAGGGARGARGSGSVVADLVSTGIMLGGLLYALKLTLGAMDPYREQRKEVRCDGDSIRCCLATAQRPRPPPVNSCARARPAVHPPPRTCP